MISQKTYNAGIYVRLSRDDERDGESLSIENQKLILTNYVREQGWNLIEYYIDDGHTGVNFDRPALKQMIEDVKDKKINLVIVKDLSRFGRNYIQVGQFIDYLFPSLGCRFVALNDNIDTALNDNEIMPFKNLLNEFYSRDISKKVKSAKVAIAQSGKFLGCYAPMGYIRNPKDTHKLIVEETGAQVIRRIFALRKQGSSIRMIANIMNSEGITCSRDHYYKLEGRENPRRITHKWSDISIKEILSNEAYIGNMVQFKTGSISYKNHKQVKKSEDNWIRVTGTHTPLIDMETWDICRELDRKKPIFRTTKEKTTSLFSGLMRCADCGCSMTFMRDSNRRKDGTSLEHHAYICKGYSGGGRGACSPHRTMEFLIIEVLSQDIRKQAAKIIYDENAVKAELIKRKDKDLHIGKTVDEKELKSARNRITELDHLIQKLYEEMVAGDIPRDVVLGLIEKYRLEKQEKERLSAELTKKLEIVKETEQDITKWMALIKRYVAVEEIDRDILIQLIDKIVIGQKTTIDGVSHQNITIHYNLVGNVD